VNQLKQFNYVDSCHTALQLNERISPAIEQLVSSNF